MISLGDEAVASASPAPSRGMEVSASFAHLSLDDSVVSSSSVLSSLEDDEELVFRQRFGSCVLQKHGVR